MSAFANQTWASRFVAMGDEAEGAFDEVFPKNHKPGLNRPEMQVSKLTLRQRYTPDRLDYGGYCEVMGLGRDQTLKLKVEKLEAMIQWSATDNVDLFVWDSRNTRWCRAAVGEWLPVLVEWGEVNVFPEGKPFIALKTKHMPFPWTKLENRSNPEVGSGLPSTSPSEAAAAPHAPQRRHLPTAPRSARGSDSAPTRRRPKGAEAP